MLLRPSLRFVLLAATILASGQPAVAADADPPWVAPMKKVHERFTGSHGTFAIFGDSITVSLAFWAPLRGEPKGMDQDTAAAHALVKKYMKPECWDKWRGPKYGNEGSTTIRWAHENVDTWLKTHNPEAAVIMFGTNDLGQLERKEFEEKTAEVVDRCLKNGTVVILTTLPPRSGLLEKSKLFAEVVRGIAQDKKVPLLDYHAEILKRRPDDWDGSLPKFKDVKGDEYNVPTLIARDGVHPSNPQSHRDYSTESLRCNGYMLRNRLTLTAYVEVIRKVLPAALPRAEEALSGLREFYGKTARADGSFQPGIDPDYLGMSDCAASDLAAVTYAVSIHKTLGWKLPHEAKTAEFLLSRQKDDGAFFNVAGTYAPNAPEARCYNTTQGLVALHALGFKPRYDPLPVFQAILKEDYKSLPPYSTSFFPLAYLCAGRPIPQQADRSIRAMMVQDETGYLNDHIAATFHASHYYRLIGEETPKSEEMVARILRDQKPDGSWMLNMPSRDRHATFDAVFTLVHEGRGRADCRAAIRRAADWALSCRNTDGGFGHFPGSASDADAVYFQTGVLVMAGFLQPCDPLPTDPQLLSWGHLMPVVKKRVHAADVALKLPGWATSVAFSPDGKRLAVGCADKRARIFDAASGRLLVTQDGHDDYVASVCFDAHGKLLATGSFDHTAAIRDSHSGELLHKLTGHHGIVTSVAFSPDSSKIVTASVDHTVKLWDVGAGKLKFTLEGHKSWVNSLAFSADGEWIITGSSDGTVRVWSPSSADLLRTVQATTGEVRSVAISADGKHIAAGLRYGTVKVWSTSDWKEELSLEGREGDTWAVTFSPDSRVLASVEGDWNRGGIITLRQIPDGKPLKRLQHTGEILSVAFAPDGKSLAAAAADKTVKIWDLARMDGHGLR